MNGPALVAVLLLTAGMLHAAGGGTSFLPNVGFNERSRENPDLAEGWQHYGDGYVLDDQVKRSGRYSIRCDKEPGQSTGASYTIMLNQTRPEPIEVTGWSRAENVTGVIDNGYSIYFDVQFMDGTYHWEHTSPFSIGTHDWEQRRLVYAPHKPVKALTVYAIFFRDHAGTVWFDDFEGRILHEPFDSQAIAPPKIREGMMRGWFVRDVAGDGEVLPLATDDRTPLNGADQLELGLKDIQSEQDGRIVRATLENQTDEERAVTLYYIEQLPEDGAEDATWWYDIRRSGSAADLAEGTNLVNTSAGAIGWMSRYPWGCITMSNGGRALGVPPDLGARIFRIGYHPPTRLLYVAFDLSVPARSQAAERAPVTAAIARYDVDSQWGFRDAAATFYAMFPQAFERRATADGIWLPFTDPAKIDDIDDFHIAWHHMHHSMDTERFGIQSFRYIEPRSYVQSLPRTIPRDYDAAVEVIEQDLKGDDETKRRWAEAVFTSGAKHRDGRFIMTFQVAPWSDGAVWVLNPNPHLPRQPDQWTKARLNFSEQDMARHEHHDGGWFAGEFLDSLEAEADHLDFRPESLRHTRLPLTFTTDDTRAATLPIWFSEYEYVAWLHDWLRQRDKLLLANTALTRFHVFAPVLDLMAIEAVWGTSERFEPDSDEVLTFRRTMCFRKPYHILQNNDYDKFGRDAVERFFRRCAFYAIFPSMFSVDAASAPYWEDPRWYNRDRDLFRRYIPIIKDLSAARWEPITHARSDHPMVYLERYGREFLTVLNDSDAPVQASIELDIASITGQGGPVMITEVFSGDEIPQLIAAGGRVTVILEIDAGDTSAMKIAAGDGKPQEVPHD